MINDPKYDPFMRKDKNEDDKNNIPEDDEIIVEGKNMEEEKNSQLNKDNNDIKGQNKESVNNGEKVDDDNYLILKYNKNNSEEFPIFLDIINKDYNKEYQPPVYITPKSVLNEREKQKKEKYEKEHLYDDQKNLSINKNEDGELKNVDDIIKENDEYNDYEVDKDEKEYEKKKNINNKNDKDKDNGKNNNKDEKKENENYLQLINNQKLSDNLILFENIISKDFKEDYTIPTYLGSNYVQKEIKNEEKKEEKKNENDINNKEIKEDNDDQKINNIIGSNEYPDKVLDINDNDNKKIEEINSGDDKNKNTNEQYSDYNDGDFVESTQVKVNNGNEIKENLVENIINSDNNNDFSLPNMKSQSINKNEEEKNEDLKNEMKGNYVDYNNYNGKDYPTVQEIVKKDYNEEEQKKELPKKDKIKKLKESLNNEEEDDDKIVVDALDEDNEDNEENYGGFD